jgi:hypothetical protein
MMPSTEYPSSLPRKSARRISICWQQNQALAALLFLYRERLERDLDLEGVVRARKRRRLPVGLSEEEVRTVRELLSGDAALVVGLCMAVACD